MNELEVFLILKLDSIRVILGLITGGFGLTMWCYAAYFWISG